MVPQVYGSYHPFWQRDGPELGLKPGAAPLYNTEEMGHLYIHI